MVRFAWILVDHAKIRATSDKHIVDDLALTEAVVSLEIEVQLISSNDDDAFSGVALDGEPHAQAMKSSRLKNTLAPSSSVRFSASRDSSLTAVTPSASRKHTNTARSSTGVLPMMPARKYGLWAVRKN